MNNLSGRNGRIIRNRDRSGFEFDFKYIKIVAEFVV